MKWANVRQDYNKRKLYNRQKVESSFLWSR